MPNISKLFGRLLGRFRRGEEDVFDEGELDFELEETEMSDISPFGEEGLEEDIGEEREEEGGPSEGEETTRRLNELTNKVSKVEMSINTIQRDYNELKETLEKTNQSVLELLSLYELVSNQVNPFVGEGEKGSALIERLDKLEKRVNEFGELTSALKNELDALTISTQGLAEKGVHINDEKLSEIDVKLDTLMTTVAYLDEEMTHISERMQVLEGRAQNPTTDGGVAPSPKPHQWNLSSSPHSVPATISTSSGVKLEKIENTPANVVLLLNWIEFLMERVGRNNLADALDYYVEIGWISEQVASTMLSYARGLDYYVEKPTWRLLPEDHTKSLLFIERLLGNKIDRARLNSVEREMAKVKHGLEELYGI